MDNDKTIYTGDISDKELQRFKAVHGKVHRLEVPVNDEFTEIAVCYLKPVERQMMSMFLSTDDKIQRSELMLGNLWLAGDERIKTDDEMFYSASISLHQLLSFRASQLKKNWTQQNLSTITTQNNSLEK